MLKGRSSLHDVFSYTIVWPFFFFSHRVDPVLGDLWFLKVSLILFLVLRLQQILIHTAELVFKKSRCDLIIWPLFAVNCIGFLSNTEYSISLPLLLSAISTPYFLHNCLHFSPPMNLPIVLETVTKGFPQSPKQRPHSVGVPSCFKLSLQLYSNSQMQLGQSLSFHKNSQPPPRSERFSPCKCSWNIFLTCKYVLIVIGMKDSSVPVSVDVCSACIESI